MASDELHYRIIRRGKDISYVLARESGTYYNEFDFLTEDRYPYNAEGYQDAMLMAELLTILEEANQE